MKTFAFALCILVLALTIQDISARPRGRGPQGQRGPGQRGLGQRGQGQRGQGQRGQGQRGQGQRGPEGRRRGGPKLHKLVCQVQNATTLEVVCDNSSRCPDFAECSPPPAGGPQSPVRGDFLIIHICLPKVCDPADPAACPTNSTCIPGPEGIESRCIPDFRPRRRHSGSSSEESLEESEESLEESEEDVEEEEVDDDEKSEEDFETCGAFVKNAVREARGRAGRGGRRGLKFKTCLLRNRTSNTMLCNQFMSCPEFTECIPTSSDNGARRPMVESLEIHECRPMDCTPEGSACPTDTTCQQVGPSSWCLPEGQRQGRRRGGRDDEEDESCNDQLKDIIREAFGRRPSGRRPASDEGLGGNGDLGQGQGGISGFGQGQGRIEVLSRIGFGQGQRRNGQGQNGRSGRRGRPEP